MKSLHIKSIILGMGMGIVLTSIISMIYLAGMNPNTKMTREEIITEAKKIGMVEETSLISESVQTTSEQGIRTENKAESNNVSENKATAEAKKDADKKPVQEPPAQQPVQTIDIRVNDGEDASMIAQNLLQKGIISDKDNFINAIKSVKLQGHIKSGDYKIKSGTDINSLIQIITQ